MQQQPTEVIRPCEGVEITKLLPPPPDVLPPALAQVVLKSGARDVFFHWSLGQSHPQYPSPLPTPPPPHPPTPCLLLDLVPGVYEGGFKLWEGRSLLPPPSFILAKL
jgi:hypothetical protein